MTIKMKLAEIRSQAPGTLSSRNKKFKLGIADLMNTGYPIEVELEDGSSETFTSFVSFEKWFDALGKVMQVSPSIGEPPNSENSCWGAWVAATDTLLPGLYFTVGLTGSGRHKMLDLTRSTFEAKGVRVVDGCGIVQIDNMLQGIVVHHGELVDVPSLQRAINLSCAGAVVLCSMFGRGVSDALRRLQSPVYGSSMDVVGRHLRAAMAQILIPKIPEGRTCINEIAVFETVAHMQMVLENGVPYSLRNDAEAKIAAGILTRESAEQAGALD